MDKLDIKIKIINNLKVKIVIVAHQLNDYHYKNYLKKNNLQSTINV